MLKNQVIDVNGERFAATVESKVIADELKECTYTLKIFESNPEDVGTYTLLLNNEYGDASCDVSNYRQNFLKSNII